MAFDSSRLPALSVAASSSPVACGPTRDTHAVKKLLGLLVALLCFFLAVSVDAKDVRVKGYTRRDGTYVAPHTRTSPNRTKNDNYSTRGNVNPYTGKAGTKPRERELPKATSTDPASGKSIEPAPVRQEEPKVVGWPSLKSGMPQSELLRQLGPAKEVEGKGEFEIWSYPAGAVFVKEGKVVAWKEERSR